MYITLCEIIKPLIAFCIMPRTAEYPIGLIHLKCVLSRAPCMGAAKSTLMPPEAKTKPFLILLEMIRHIIPTQTCNTLIKEIKALTLSHDDSLQWNDLPLETTKTLDERSHQLYSEVSHGFTSARE